MRHGALPARRRILQAFVKLAVTTLHPFAESLDFPLFGIRQGLQGTSFSAMADSAAEHTLNSSKSRSCGSLFVTMILPLIILQRRDGYAPSGAKGFELFEFKRHMGNDSGRRAAFQIDHFIAVMVVVRREAIGGAPAVPLRHRGPRRRDALVRRCADGVRHALDRRAPVGGYARIGGNSRNLLRGNAVDSHTTSYPKIRERVWFIFCWMASCVEIDFWINSDRLSLMLFNASRLARIRS